MILQDIFCIERALSLVLLIEIQEIYQLFDLFVSFIDQKTLFWQIWNMRQKLKSKKTIVVKLKIVYMTLFIKTIKAIYAFWMSGSLPLF